MKLNRPLFCGMALLSASPLYAAERPNVLFIMLDDFGYHQLGCNGSTFFETPNIDRLASEGMNFTNAYASAPVSSPTRAALMSGLYPARTHVTDWLNGYAEPETSLLATPNWTKGLPQDEIRLPVMMQEAGYTTAMIGKWHLSKDLPGWDLINRSDGPDITQESDWHNVTKYTDAAIAFMADCQEKGEPFFCYLSHNSIHTPETEEAALIQKYRNKPGATEKGMWNPVQGAMVETVDKETGRLLQAVEELGLDENTIIIFYADNGQFTPNEKVGPSPLRGGKVTLWEGGVREPLIVKWKGHIEAGSVSQAQVVTVDFMPTLHDLCGLTDDTYLDGIDGISFVDELLGRETNIDRHEYLCWHYPHYHPEAQYLGSIRRGNWKLIENFTQSLYFDEGAFELYDLEADPDESENLIDEEPERAAELYASLQSWREETNAQMPYLKKETFGVAHFVFHQSGEPVKVNGFERKQQLATGMQSDGEGTFMTLADGGSLTYYYDKLGTDATTVRLLCQNPGDHDVTVRCLAHANRQEVVVKPGRWTEVTFDVTALPIGKGQFEVSVSDGRLNIDKWVMDDGSYELRHDGTMDDEAASEYGIATFEDGAEEGYSAFQGNANNQDPTPVVVANPYRTQPNSTEKCLYVRTEQDPAKGIPAWSANNIVIRQKNKVEIDEDNRFLHIMHWKERKLNSWLIYGSADGKTYVELGRGTCPAAKSWFDIVVDVKSQLTALQSIKIILDGNWGTIPDRYYEPTDFYYDEIVLNGTYLSRTEIESSVESVRDDRDKLVTLAPNPAKDFVKMYTEVPVSRVDIYTSNGTLVKSQECNPDETNAHWVNIQGLVPGCYWLVARQPDRGIHTLPLLVSANGV